MRIAHVQSWYVAGQGYQENHLPYQQLRLGHEVRLFTSDRILPRSKWAGMGHWIPGLETDRGIVIHRLPVIWENDARAQILLKGLWQAVNEFQPDIIHLHGLWMGPVAQVVIHSLSSNYRMVVDDHTDGDNLNLSRWITRMRLGLVRWLWLPILQRRVDHFIAVNPFSERFLTDGLRLPRERVTLLPLGIDDQNYYPDPSCRMQTRDQWGVSHDDVVIITSGLLDPSKGLDLLLQAMVVLSAEQTNLKLVIVGRGPETYMSELRKQIAGLGLSPVVIFSGWADSQEAMNCLFNGADIAIIAKKLNSTKEALGVGLPLIVPDHPATKYFVSNQNGLTFDKENIVSLVASLRVLSTNSILRERYGQRSLALVKETLAWRVVAQGSVLLYQNIIARTPAMVIR